MAKEKAEDTPKKSKLPMLIIIIFVLIIGAVGGAFGVNKFMAKKEPQSAQAQSESKILAAKPVMMALSPFTINLSKSEGDNTDHYIKISLSLAVTDDTAKTALKNKLPAVRDSVISILSQKKQSDILENGNNLLTMKNQIKNSINNAVGLQVVNDVYVTDMVLQ